MVDQLAVLASSIDEAESDRQGSRRQQNGARQAFEQGAAEAAAGRFARAIEQYATAWELASGTSRSTHSHHSRHRRQHDD